MVDGDEHSITTMSEQSHFQTVEIAPGVPSSEDEPSFHRMFVQQLCYSPMSFKPSSKDDIDLRDKVLLDIQSTIDL